MAGHDVIVIGASAGGVEALIKVARALPKDLPASVFVVLHLPSDGTSALPAILDRAGPLAASHPEDGELIVPSRIYVAPPDYHLAVEPGRVRVTHGPRENRHRPAIDRLFRSAAYAYGPRVVGVVLSGTLDDGVGGLRVIKQHRGIAIVQDPADALYNGMPISALKYVDVDYCLPAARIGSGLADLAGRPAVAEGAPAMASDNRNEILEEAGRDPTLDSGFESTFPSAFVCPECGGTLWEMREGDLVRYRCRVGHAYSEESLWADHTDGLEAALWAALRLLEENSDLARRLAERSREIGSVAAAARFEERAADAGEQAMLIQEAIRKLRRPADDEHPSQLERPA
jgi:two-component system chemotaxis response regulator CheB